MGEKQLTSFRRDEVSLSHKDRIGERSSFLTTGLDFADTFSKEKAVKGLPYGDQSLNSGLRLEGSAGNHERLCRWTKEEAKSEQLVPLRTGGEILNTLQSQPHAGRVNT